jgi:hypothetical protein
MMISSPAFQSIDQSTVLIPPVVFAVIATSAGLAPTVSASSRRHAVSASFS